jgi:hypothetical protein
MITFGAALKRTQNGSSNLVPATTSAVMVKQDVLQDTITPGDRQHFQEARLRGWRWWLLAAVAGLTFVLGVLGAFLPVLPATPFLLLTSYLLIRISPRLNRALLRSRLLGPILIDWQVHGGIRTHVRAQAIVIALIAVGATLILSGAALIPKIVVGLLATIGIGVVLRLPTAKPPQPDQEQTPGN